jgi:hypothetical protein
LIGSDSNQRSSQSAALSVKRSRTIALGLHRQRVDSATLRNFPRGPAPETAPHVGRRLEQQRAQHVRHALEAVVVRRQAPGVAPPRTRDLALRRLEPAAHLDVAAISSGRKLENGRSMIRRPCSARRRSRITFGLSRLTV